VIADEQFELARLDAHFERLLPSLHKRPPAKLNGAKPADAGSQAAAQASGCDVGLSTEAPHLSLVLVSTRAILACGARRKRR